MNWVVFSLVLWGLMGLELGLKDALRLGETPVAPSFVMSLAVVVSLAAPTNAALWACLAIGVVLDLTNPIEVLAGGPDRTVLGPYALGHVLACQLVLTMRGLMMRKNVLTVGFLALFCSFVCHVVVTAILAIRLRYDHGVVFEPTQELMWRFGSSLYSGIAGIVLGAALLPLLGTMGLSIGPSRRFARRTT